jgi:sulfatase modifying factor 1
LSPRASALCALLACTSCERTLPPVGQVVLVVDTDAWLPTRTGQQAVGSDAPPLFDRIRFDIVPSGQQEPCQACSREFVLLHDTVASGRASIGIKAPPGQTGHRVRVSIYWHEFVVDGEPIARNALQAWVALPPLQDDGVLEGTVFLGTSSVGVPTGSALDPIAWPESSPDIPRPGTWHDAVPVDCAATPSAGEVCVPGGAFWKGRPQVPGGAQRDDTGAATLVVLAPFILDRTEVNVGQIRTWLLAGGEAETDDPFPFASFHTEEVANTCAMPEDWNDGSRDLLPVNCISYELARSYCRSRPFDGSDLPTEAQLERAAARLDGLFPWGIDEPRCGDAVFGRGGGIRFTDGLPSECLSVGESGGPLPVGSGARDQVPYGTGDVRDLAGNLAELALDTWDPQLGPCWTPSLLRDPLCTHAVPGEAPLRTTKGGHWASSAYELQTAFRSPVSDRFAPQLETNTRLGPMVGFRCARPAR